MKANRNFREADEAVSPVIGVILMVAITVVLAAVVFVLVSDLGDTGDSAPELGFTRDEQDDELTVSKADPGLNWTEFEIRASEAVEYTVNGANTNGLTANTAETVASVDVQGGDVFAFCGGVTGTGVAKTDVTIVIRHKESNSQIGSYEFTTIAACA